MHEGPIEKVTLIDAGLEQLVAASDRLAADDEQENRELIALIEADIASIMRNRILSPNANAKHINNCGRVALDSTTEGE